MGDVIIEVDVSEVCKVVVICVNGDIFCVGNEILGFVNYGKELYLVEIVGFMKVLINCKKLVIVEVLGLVVGIGIIMLLYCDLVYCVIGIWFVLFFINLGLVFEYVFSYIIFCMVGCWCVSEWLMLGEFFSV